MASFSCRQPFRASANPIRPGQKGAQSVTSLRLEDFNFRHPATCLAAPRQCSIVITRVVHTGPGLHQCLLYYIERAGLYKSRWFRRDVTNI